ncbi:MAG: PrgI family protein [Candidatus Pacebacteria bacterium]|nr:PrgI family protein [Candidatus Paceibacterota bacterium]
MRFQIPQFIERELKIVGPLTLRQFAFLAAGFLSCIGLYMVLFEISFFLFLILVILIMGTAVALAFFKINGRPLTTALANFIVYLFAPKSYLWQRKSISPQLIKTLKPKRKQEEKKEKTDFKISQKSQLQNLSNKLEIGI